MKCILFLEIFQLKNVNHCGFKVNLWLLTNYPIGICFDLLKQFLCFFYVLLFSADDAFKLLVTFDVISEGSNSPNEIKDKISDQIQEYRRIDQFGVSAERFSFRNVGGKFCMLSVQTSVW